MRATNTARNLVLAASMSFAFTLILALLYVLFPLMLVVLSSSWNSSGTAGIGAVAGGVSASFVRILPLLAVVLFLIIFGLLQRKQLKN